MRRRLILIVPALLACEERPAAGSGTSQPDGATTSAVPPAPARAAPSGPVPAFEVALWPGEGIPVLQAAASRLMLHESPRAGSRVVGAMETVAGRTISFDSTSYQTITVGSIQVLAAAQVRGRDLGAIRFLSRETYHSRTIPLATFDVTPGKALDFLQHRAEGTCFVRLNQRVIDADPCPVHDKEKFRAVREPSTQWWVRPIGAVENAGWVIVSDSTVKIVKRSF